MIRFRIKLQQYSINDLHFSIMIIVFVYIMLTISEPSMSGNDEWSGIFKFIFDDDRTGGT